MLGDWGEVFLWDVAEYINGRATKTSELCDDGVPVIKIAELNRGITDQTERIPAELVKEEHWIKEGDLLFAWSGSVGVYTYRGPKAALNQHIFKVTAKSGFDQRFVRYLLLYQLPVFRRYVEDKKTTMGHVTVRDLQHIKVRVPPLPEQTAIAHILGTLDDKIELNRRMSETLELMARALFKAWFVDFEPVRAKMEGRWRRGESLPGLPAHLYDLFPDRLVPSELGEIPEGWGVGTFGDVVELLRETENPLESPDVVFSHFSIPAYDEGQWPKHEAGESIKSLKLRVPPGVVLLSKLNPEIERVWLVDIEPNDRAICSTEFLVLAPRATYGRSYVYCFARSRSFREDIEGLVTGTSKSHQRVQVGAILGLAVVRPPESLLSRFESAADPLLTRALACRRESRTLAAIRDALLPKLVSGDLRVKDAEWFLKERALCSLA